MVEIDGEYELVDEEPQDSSFLYNPGLMTLEFERSKIVSHSWDGRESWEINSEEEKIYLYGKRDTLYGKMAKDQLVFQSTLDDRPTYYHFSQFDEKVFSTPNVYSDEWTVNSENNLLKDLKITFTTDSSYQIENDKSLESKIYFTYNLGKFLAFEYNFPSSSDMSGEHELATVYLYQTKRKKVMGVFYPISDGLNAPVRSTLSIKKKRR